MSERWELAQKQSLELPQKIRLSEKRIQQWYEHWQGNVYVAFSGGRDSTILLHLVRSMYPRIPAVFVDTGLEYPEIREFVKNIKSVIWLKPDMSFKEVLEQYGYPVVSKKVSRMIRTLQNPTPKNIATRNLYLTGIKRNGKKSSLGRLPSKWFKLIRAPFKCSEQCCDALKKIPVKKYTKESGRIPFIGTMASDSEIRELVYLKQGCNAFKAKTPKSSPLSFWLDTDIKEYIKIKKITCASIYKVDKRGIDLGVRHTGCMFCMFGVHLELFPNRFQQMEITHPNQYDYCINKLGIGTVLKFIGVSYKNKPTLFS